MATVNIVTHHTNGAGLQKDSDLLAGILQARGHTVRRLQHLDPLTKAGHSSLAADVNFFLEVVCPAMLRRGNLNVVVPNSEWWCDNTWGGTLPAWDMVLCKTTDCMRIWEGKVHPSRCRFIGWEAPDRYMPGIRRQVKFVHMAGKSETKNTAAVMEAWKTHKIPYPLTTSAHKESIVRLCRGIKNVYHTTRFPEADMPTIMNEFLIHVMPSKYEGYGMYLHEALGCGAVVITTDAEPMKSFSGIPPELLVKVSSSIPVRAARFNVVDPADLARAVMQAAALSIEDIQRMSMAARLGFLTDREHFRKALPAALTEIFL